MNHQPITNLVVTVLWSPSEV